MSCCKTFFRFGGTGTGDATADLVEESAVKSALGAELADIGRVRGSLSDNQSNKYINIKKLVIELEIYQIKKKFNLRLKNTKCTKAPTPNKILYFSK